jgi:hypothetical protein
MDLAMVNVGRKDAVGIQTIGAVGTSVLVARLWFALQRCICAVDRYTYPLDPRPACEFLYASVPM